MQRLHQADPTGEWLDRVSGEVESDVRHICLPAELIYDEQKKPLYVNPPELAGFYEDGLMDPIRIPKKVLQAKLKILGAYGYAGQMMQSPVPLGGGTFEVDKLELRNDPSANIIRKVRSWDKAGTQDGGNFSAGVLLGEDKKGRFWILDVVRGQWSAAGREALILQTAQMDGKGVEIELEIEGGSGGKESAENTVKMLAGYIVRATHPTGDKEARAYPLASQMGSGNVICLLKEWTKEFVDELRYFPSGRYDDQVDAASSAFNRVARKKITIGPLPIGTRVR
jgi:predicted phage terminase large subunit-like protein